MNNIGLAAILTLVGALTITGWKLNSVTDELNGLKVSIGIQDKLARAQAVKFKENQIELTKTHADRVALIAANRLLRNSKNTTTTSPIADSTQGIDGGLTAASSERIEAGFRDQCVDVANRLEGLKLFVVVSKIPVSAD